MGVCSNSNQRAQPLQMDICLNLELISSNHNQLQPKFAAKTVANEKDIRPALTGQALTFDQKKKLLEPSASENNNPMCI